VTRILHARPSSHPIAQDKDRIVQGKMSGRVNGSVQGVNGIREANRFAPLDVGTEKTRTLHVKPIPKEMHDSRNSTGVAVDLFKIEAHCVEHTRGNGSFLSFHLSGAQSHDSLQLLRGGRTVLRAAEGAPVPFKLGVVIARGCLPQPRDVT
jgi:hypothetical protein